MTCVMAMGLYAQIPAGDGQPCPNTPTVTDHEGNVYATVQIGQQCWMRDNLRTTTSPSTGTYLIPAVGTGYTYTGKQARWYNDDSATYAPMNYGLLYNWNAAVDTFNTAYGETSVNSISSNAVSVTFTGHRRGICPAGWHLPSDAEWTTLEQSQTTMDVSNTGWRGDHAGKLAGGSSWITSTTAKAPGNMNYGERNTSGFSAVPAGYSYGSSFYNVGYSTTFCSATHYNSYSAYHRYLYYSDADVSRNGVAKSNGCSVRCIRDFLVGSEPPIGDVTPCPYVPTVTDIDGNVYNTVKIGNQCWMKENMRTTKTTAGTPIPKGDGYASSNTAPYYYNDTVLFYSWDDNYDMEVLGADGYYYNWTAAQTICPAGWHLPSDTDWILLENYVSSQGLYTCGTNMDISKALASTNGWDEDYYEDAMLAYLGEDLYNTINMACMVRNQPENNNATGFSAYPSGMFIGYYDDDGNDLEIGVPILGNGTAFYFWTSLSVNNTGGAFTVDENYTWGNYNHASLENFGKRNGLSVRCIRDATPIVTTGEVLGLSSTTATCSGEILDMGGGYTTNVVCGICWSTSHNPTTDDAHTAINKTETDTFSSQLTNLIPGVTYYVRAYASNWCGTVYGEEISFKTPGPCPGLSTVTDVDGNVYNTVKIGNQCWMKENLRTTKYADGTSIPTGGNDTVCYYDYVTSSIPLEKRGLLYTWPAVMHGASSSNSIPSGVQGICPMGWHVPSDAEWIQLIEYVSSVPLYWCGNESVNIAKALAANEYWHMYDFSNKCLLGSNLLNPSERENNATGFSAEPVGSYGSYGNEYSLEGISANFWTSTISPEYINAQSNYRYLTWANMDMKNFLAEGNLGFSVRCLRDLGPVVITDSVLGVTTSTATCGGGVVDDGGFTVTARGVCWSTEHNPTIANAHTSNGTGVGAFTSNITGLTPGTTYYVRAYATNSEGTTYGEEVGFFTSCLPEDQCELTFVLTDSYGDGWNGNEIQVTDAETGVVIGTLSNVDLDGFSGSIEETQTLTLTVCDGRTVNFEWITGGWSYETSYTVYDIHGEVIFSGTGGFSEPVSYRVNCCRMELDGNDTYIEDFESYTASTTAATGVEPTCWQLVREDVTMTDANRPQLYYKNTYAHSGNYSLKMGYRGVYAMPGLITSYPLHELRLEMYLRQPYANHQLEVGVWETNGTFVPVDTFNNSTANVEHVVCDFSAYTGNGHRIAFRNTLNDGTSTSYSYNYLDDIVLRRMPANDAKPCPNVPTVTDIDGNVYNTVQIGEQCWMKENLRTTRFADGVEIPLLTSSSNTDAYRYIPNNDPNTVAEYGYLYNWSAVMHGANASDANPSGVQGICPAGWHVPSDAEWSQLTNYVSSQTVYGCGNDNNAIVRALSASAGWLYDEQYSNECGPAYNLGANNATGFNALPAGYYECYYGSGYGYAFGSSTYFWTSSVSPSNLWAARVYNFGRSSTAVNSGTLYEYYGESIRCVLGEGGNVPVVTTGRIRITGDSTATCEGAVTADGGDDVVARGICWNMYGSPTVSGSHTEEGVGLGSFTSMLTDLTPGTRYYVRAYATNATGTAYGEQTFFVVPDCHPIPYLPYSERFENYTGSTTAATGVEPNCWELVQEDVSMTDANRPQLYYKSDYAHSGSYSLLLNYRGVYAMPELSDHIPMKHVKLEMYLRQPKSYYALEVGVWEDDGTFVPVATFNNSSTGVEFVECNFSSYKGSGKRIAFRNISGDNTVRNYSYNYIDDIWLTDACSDGIMLPYSEDFDSYTTSTTAATGEEPMCWELVQSDVQTMTDANRPQLYYKSDYAHSGSYSLLLNYRGVYAMPELSWDMEELTLDRVKMEMYVRQPKAVYQLEVGVWDDEEGVFVPVQRINNSTTGVEKVTVDFSGYEGWGRQIAFRNVLADGCNYNYSYNYIDDITLTEIPYTECSITLPYSENFDSYTESTATATGVEPDCWELVQEDVQMTDANRPQLCYKSSYAHSGNYSLRMTYRGVYAMPALSDETEVPMNRVKLEMYLRQSNAAYQLEVGVWEDNGTFVPVKRFNNSTTGVEYVTCDFSGYTGNGRRIAFRNVLGNGANYAYSYNFLDDIVLTEIPDCAITLPYSENFDSYTQSTATATGVEPDCWELVQEDVQMTDANRPQLCYKSSYAHSGNYSLRMTYRGVYAMPALSDETEVPMNRVKLEMYLRQSNAAYQLEVGVWEDNGTFVPVKRFNNSTTGVEYVTCDFSGYTGNGRRIAFRNVLGNGANYAYSYNFLDDIVLTEIPDCAITLPYSENFDSYTESTATATGVEPDCWELVQEDVQMTDANRPQLCYKSSYAHSGNYSLRMTYRGVYAMPALSDETEVPMNRVKLEMYLRQSNAAYQLEVGVWEDNGTFVPVKRFNNSTTGVEYVTCDFSGYTGSGRRIAFRNVLASTANYNYSYNYLDDITLSLVTNKSAEVTDANTAAADPMAAARDMVDIIVYPNPTKDYVNVECTMNNVQCSGIEVIDMYGKVVRTVVGANNDSPTQINVSGLAAGMYFVRVTTENGAVTKPFVKR